MWIGIVMILPVIAGMLIIDRLHMPAHYARASLTLSVTIVTPALLLLTLVSAWPRLNRLARPLTAAFAFAGGLGYLWLLDLAIRDAMPINFAGFVAITVFVYLCLGLGFYLAALVGLSLFAILVGGVLVPQGLTADMVYNVLYGAFANLVGLHGAYLLEHRRRRGYLEARLLEIAAGEDKLTGLANRRRIDEQLEFAWRQAREHGGTLALLLVDIDHFKRYNDHFGHQAGDRALKQVGRTVADALRRPTDLAGRYGGEEFLVLLTDTDRQFAGKLAEQIRERVLALRISQAADGTDGVLTVSVGVAVIVPASADRSLEGFVQVADEALYEAKEGGRNQVRIAGSDTSIQTGIFRGVTTDSYPTNSG